MEPPECSQTVVQLAPSLETWTEAWSQVELSTPSQRRNLSVTPVSPLQSMAVVVRYSGDMLFG